MRPLTLPPRHLPEALKADWAALLSGERSKAFDPAMAAELPDPARRWLLHALPPGTPLHTRVELELHGRIKLGSWRPFTAVQALAPPYGYIWAERTSLFGIPVTGYDRLTRGSGRMRHSLPGGIPLVRASGPDLTRSAAARLAAELVLVPAAALSPSVIWKPVDDFSSSFALIHDGGRQYEATITVAASGALERVSIVRWARIGSGPYREELFTVLVNREAACGGPTIPVEITAGYVSGGPFIVQTVDRMRFH